MKNKINIKLLLINLIGIVTATVFLTVFSSRMIRSVFEMRFSDKLHTPGHIFLSQYTYKDIYPYIELLQVREGFATESRDFHNDWQFVQSVDKQTSSEYTAEYIASRERMGAFVDRMSELKDEKYHTIKKRMLELRVGAGLTYFYIFADIGLPDHYVHIFDAVFQGEATSLFSEDYGIPILKSEYAQAAGVFDEGNTVMMMSDNRNSDLNSSFLFMPIKDEYGDVVAIMGTEINTQSLETQLQSFLLNSGTIILVGSLLLLCAMYFALRMLIIKPIQKLTDISSQIAVGNIDNEIPLWIVNRKDEMGILGESFASMGNVLQQMLIRSDALLEAAISGDFDIVRSESAGFEGSFALVAEKTNEMLDVIGSDLDSIPSSLAILNAEYEIVFCNDQFKKTFMDVAAEDIFKAVLDANSETNTDTDTNLDSYADSKTYTDANTGSTSCSTSGSLSDVISGSDVDTASNGGIKERLAALLEIGELSALVWFDLPIGRRCLSFLCRQRTMRDGMSNGAVIIVTDATELVDAKDRAMSANNAKSEFLSRVSHELRTPLNVILSMAKLGLSDKELVESVERFEKIVASSSHLSDIINDVLEMSRMESGKTEIKPEPLHLREIVQECMELFAGSAAANSIALLSTFDEDIPYLLVGDAFRVKQVLINLLSNAVKFTIEGEVSLDVSIIDKNEEICNVSFTVSDTGIGMSEEFLTRIFSPFVQEDSYLSRRYEGSGLGLSISHNLTMLMGGTMDVVSELGKGSSFTFTIPFGAVDAAQEVIAGETDDVDEFSLHGKRILLVDDIDINRIIIREVLGDTGAQFDEAGDGEEAVKKLMDSPEGYFSCILMDIQMPKMDGYAATRAIRASSHANNNVPILAMTANALQEDIERARASGMNDHIAKPIDFEECLKKVMKWSV